jgi:hypothetical protein
MQTPQADCGWLVTDKTQSALMAEKITALGWEEVTRLKRPTTKDEILVLYRPAKPVN